MARSPQARIDDMLSEIRAIRTATQNVSFEQFRSLWHLQRAVERGLEIISEASRSVPGELKELAPDIPWRQIADLGNFFRHAYQHVEPSIVWAIVQEKLEPLERALQRISQRAG